MHDGARAPEKTKKRLCNRLPNHGNIKAGGEGAAYLQVAMPENSGARFLLSTVEDFTFALLPRVCMYTLTH